MKRYTKWLAIIMAASMILTTATACGKKDTVAETYKTMAQEYMDKLDYASAIEILQKGIEETNNEELASMLETCMEWEYGFNEELTAIVDYTGFWSNQDFGTEMIGKILEVTINDDVITFTYTEKDLLNGTTATFGKTMDISEASDCEVSFDFVDDWNNSGTISLVFDCLEIQCSISNLTYNSSSWGVSEGSFIFDGQFSTLEDLYSYHNAGSDDGTQEEYDLSHTSGILAYLGITEQEFRDGCEPIMATAIGKQVGVFPKDIMDYPANYEGYHFYTYDGINNTIDIIEKGMSTDNYPYYVADILYDDYALIFDYRDDVYAPTISEGDRISPYMIFQGVQTIDGTDFLAFWLISADK